MTLLSLFENVRSYLPEKQVKGFSIDKLFCGQVHDLDYNPFGGLKDEELRVVLSERYDLSEIVKEVEAGENLIIEFIGKKGRGKTTHLRRLSQLLPESFYFNPDIQSVSEIKIDYPVILLDSFHKLSLFQRQSLMKQHQGVIIHTDHFSRFAEYFFCNKKWKTYLFKGLDINVLGAIVKQRIKVVNPNIDQYLLIDKEQIRLLLDAFGDDYRGILNFLYTAYRNEYAQPYS